MTALPTVEDFASDTMHQRFGEPYNPPGLTNFLGCVQVDVDVTGIRSFNIPPLATSDTVTAGLFVNGRYFPSTGCPVAIRWYPDRIERTATYDDLLLRTTTFLGLKKAAAVVLIDVENLTESDREVEIRLGLRGSVTQLTSSWNTPYPPAELDNKLSVDDERRALVFVARWSKALQMQGATPLPDDVTPHGLSWTFELRGRGRWSAAYVNVMAPDATSVRELYDEVIADPRAEFERVQDDWRREIEAIFTPGNDRYSGSLPMLETSDEDLRRLYLTGVMGVVSFKRDNPASAVGRAYDTLMPKFWQTVTFMWDYALSSLVHAMLDPAVMRRNMTHWMSTDIHTHFGTEWLTGAPVGCWYSVNDHAMLRCAHEYLRWTGDHAFVDHDVAAPDGSTRPVLDYLGEYASNWERFKTINGLADYGKIGNLLECVSTYVHEVASLNAANVWNLRTLSEILARRGDDGSAGLLAIRADQVCKEVQALYAEGEGWWHARTPGGSLVPVRHAYDFITTLNTIDGDLSDEQKNEMVAFFEKELRSPGWLHALSTGDPDAMFSVRPDHQWTGAYTAWPAQAVAGLYRIGRTELAFEWLQGLARSANQGPFGQAHFAESVIPPQNGGARKAPPDLPYITDWACSSGGAWVNVFVEQVFGVKAGFDGISAEPNFGTFDPDARLVGVPHQGKLYTVDRTGIRPTG